MTTADDDDFSRPLLSGVVCFVGNCTCALCIDSSKLVNYNFVAANPILIANMSAFCSISSCKKTSDLFKLLVKSQTLMTIEVGRYVLYIMSIKIVDHGPFLHQ